MTNIVRLVGHELDNGQQDLVWIFFWGETEACVAVIANSTTAFCSLFAKGNSLLRPPQQDNEVSHRSRPRSPHPRTSLRTLPSVTLSGLKSFMLKDPFEVESMRDARETLAPSGNKETFALQVYPVNNTVSSDAQSSHRVSICCFHYLISNELNCVQDLHRDNGLQNKDFV